MSMGGLIDEFAGIIARGAPDSFPDLCIPETVNETRDLRGGVSQVPVDDTLRTPIPCRVDRAPQLGGKQNTPAGVVEGITFYLAYLPALMPDGVTPVVIEPEKRLKVLARGPIPERLFFIEAAPKREGVMITVKLSEVGIG